MATLNSQLFFPILPLYPNLSVNIQHLINHPEQLNKDTLHALREQLAQYPYHHTARLLYLQNLFLLHDASFGEELRRAALFVPNRKALFNMVEGAHYEIKKEKRGLIQPQDSEDISMLTPAERTQNLIDNFLSIMPEFQPRRNKRPLTPTEATTDYATYLLELDDVVPIEQEKENNIITSFINNAGDKIVLQEEPTYKPNIADNEEESQPEEFFTETLAKIYAKQGNYDKAIEIITKLNLNYPKKNSYFADQLRFLRKLQLINNKSKQ